MLLFFGQIALAFFKFVIGGSHGVCIRWSQQVQVNTITGYSRVNSMKAVVNYRWRMENGGVISGGWHG